MKKFITFLVIAITMTAVTVGCKKTDPFNESLKQDYAAMVAQHASDSVEVIFYESHIILNKDLENAKSWKDLSIVECENVFQVNDTCYLVTHNFVDFTTEVEAVNDFWVGSVRINPNDVVLTLTDALKTYWNADFQKTTGNKVVLRSPMGPELRNPLYIIGQMNSPLFVTVDGITGEVSRIH